MNRFQTYGGYDVIETPIKAYNGQDPAIRDAIAKLEDFIGDVDNADLADDSTVDTLPAVDGLNILIERLNMLDNLGG